MARGYPAAASATEPKAKAKPRQARVTVTPSEPDTIDSEAVAQSFAKNRTKAAAMKSIADDFKQWRPAARVLRMVEAVPTQFPDYDIATRVNGHPLGRITLVHGESAEGKTEFCLGLGQSFLRAGHFFGFLDAERTTPLDWVQKMYGEMVHEPRFLALEGMDNTYEQARAAVRNFCVTIAEMRKDGRVAPDTTGLLLVDSIRKLQPKDLMKQLAAEFKQGDDKNRGSHGRSKPKGHIDGAGGRAGQIKAAYNAAWMDELVPLLADTRCSLVIIARETKDPTLDTFYTEGFKIGGGTALVFESSLLLRVTAKGVWTGPEGSKRQVGEQHVVAIEKSKVAGKQQKVVLASFHTSNGVDRPEGFWRARDVFTCALELGVIEQRGSHYFYDKKRIGQGEDGCVQRLDDEPELMGQIEQAARAAAKPNP